MLQKNNDCGSGGMGMMEVKYVEIRHRKDKWPNDGGGVRGTRKCRKWHDMVW